MKNFLVKYAEIGASAGPFTITDSTGAVVATGITRAQLLAGYMVSVDDAATGVTVTSAAPCGNSDTVPFHTAIGYLNFPGTTHVETWTSDGQSIQTNRQLTANGTIGAREGYTIVENGVINIASFKLDIGGDATSLGEFNAGGKVIIGSNNTAPGSASTIFSGATLQLGIDKCATSGSLSAVPYTIQSGAVVNLYGAYTTSTNLMAAGQVVQSGATINIEGCGGCGQGMINFQNNGIAAGATVNTKNAYTVYPSAGMSGTYNIGDGATTNWTASSYTGTIKLNSNGGWKNASCVTQPNIATNSINGKVEVGPLGGSIAPLTSGSMAFNPILSGSGPLQIGMPGYTGNYIVQGNGTAYTGTATIYGGQVQPSGNALENAQIRLANPTSVLPSGSLVTVRSVQSATPADTTARLFISLVGMNIKNQDPEPYYGTFAGASNSNLTIQAGNFQIASTTGSLTPANLVIAGSARVGGHGGSAKVGGPLIISTANGGLSLLTKPSKLSVTSFTASSGFKVDIGPAYASSPGTYTILDRTVAGTNTIPTPGTNASGLTPTFAWVGNNLVMTLSA
jgi:hypothetical protein